MNQKLRVEVESTISVLLEQMKIIGAKNVDGYSNERLIARACYMRELRRNIIALEKLRAVNP